MLESGVAEVRRHGAAAVGRLEKEMPNILTVGWWRIEGWFHEIVVKNTSIESWVSNVFLKILMYICDSLLMTFIPVEMYTFCTSTCIRDLSTKTYCTLRGAQITNEGLFSLLSH